MPDKTVEFIEQMVEQRLRDIAEELKNIGIMLEGFISQTQKESDLSKRLLASVSQTRQSLNAPLLMGGRWPRRDGDSYGIVQAQPPLAIPKDPLDGDGKTGDL